MPSLPGRRSDSLSWFRLLLALTVAGSLSAGLAAEKKKKAPDLSKLPPPTSQQGVTYQTDIKAIFDHSCVKCHGPEKPKAKLRLDSLEAALKGSENGKVIDPGRSTASALMINVAHAGDEDDWMPPPKNKVGIEPLSRDQVALIRAWIDQGAK